MPKSSSRNHKISGELSSTWTRLYHAQGSIHQHSYWTAIRYNTAWWSSISIERAAIAANQVMSADQSQRINYCLITGSEANVLHFRYIILIREDRSKRLYYTMWFENTEYGIWSIAAEHKHRSSAYYHDYILLTTLSSIRYNIRHPTIIQQLRFGITFYIQQWIMSSCDGYANMIRGLEYRRSIHDQQV
jgi:hypothetical protein